MLVESELRLKTEYGDKYCLCGNLDMITKGQVFWSGSKMAPKARSKVKFWTSFEQR